MKNLMKKITAVALLLTVIFAGVSGEVFAGEIFGLKAFAASNLTGDVDGDKKVSAADARATLRAAVGLEKFTSAQKKLADIDSDGKITAADARAILRMAVGLGNSDTENEYDIFRSGTFYAKGTMKEAGVSTPMEIAVTPTSVYMLTEFEGLEMGVMVSNEKTYLIYPAKKVYVELTDTVMNMMGMKSEDLVDADDLGFSNLQPLSAAKSVTSANINGTACKKYSFTGTDGSAVNVYMNGNKLQAIENITDGETESTTYFTSVSASVPADKTKPSSSYRKTTFVSFMTLVAAALK